MGMGIRDILMGPEITCDCSRLQEPSVWWRACLHSLRAQGLAPGLTRWSS